MSEKTDGTSKETQGKGGVKGFFSRFSKRTKITSVVVIAVLVVAGAGFFVWHEQPSFCTAICHKPMSDEYLDTYKAQPGTASTDKWGNKVSDAHAMLSAAHRADYGVTCLECHKPTLGQQIGEGITFITGSYEFPLHERNTAKLATVHSNIGDSFCLNEGCHNMTRAELTAATSGLAFNPHNDVHGYNLDCSACHKAHRASVYYCTECHSDSTIQLPAGWVTYEQNLEYTSNMTGTELPTTQITKVTAN